MPTYNYTCTKCNHNFDSISLIEQRDNKKCEKCKSETNRNVTVPQSVMLRGDGWTTNEKVLKGKKDYFNKELSGISEREGVEIVRK